MALTLEDLVIRQGPFSLTASLSVEQGEMVAVIGPSGAGKSTLINAIAGFLPVQGRVVLDGVDLTDKPPSDRPVAILFQDNNLFPHLTIAQNVGLGVRPDLKLSEAQNRNVQVALEKVGLADMGARKPAGLSGGQQSRAALARVLVQGKPVILLDEPFAALGPALRVEMLDLVAQVAADTNATVLMVSHAPEDARRIAGQTIVVADGKAHPPQPTDALFADPPQALVDYLGDR
jgi:thiamine transport system ATP-binding protein